MGREDDTSPSRPTRAGLLALALAAVAALGVLATGCGGSSGTGVAQVDTTETATTTGSDPPNGAQPADWTAYSACMREKGVPRFPDPPSNGGPLELGGPGLDPNAPQFQAAERACKALSPKGVAGRDPQAQASRLREWLRYAACMRANGVPDFPDPEVSGGQIIPTVIEGDRPRVAAAEEACRELAPGAGR
jgi:hypothetical protein